MGTMVRRSAAAAITASAVALASAGCAAHRPPGVPISVPSAYLIQPNGPGAVDGYLVIQNTGGADRLVSVRSSAGGTIEFIGPAPAGTATDRLNWLSVPAHSVLRLDPTGSHLVITGSGPMHQGNDITLTLVFAHAGTVSAIAQVTNPETGGGTYLGN